MTRLWPQKNHHPKRPLTLVTLALKVEFLKRRSEAVKLREAKRDIRIKQLERRVHLLETYGKAE